MSVESAKAFIEKVKVDSGLKEKVKTISNKKSAEKREALLKMASEMGHSFNIDDFISVTKEMSEKRLASKELSYDELTQVSGGFRSESIGLKEIFMPHS